MKRASALTVRLLNEERALLMSLAAKRDVTYSDILRLGLYQLARTEGLNAQVMQVLQARVDHLLQVEAAWCGIRMEQTAESSHTGGV
ncbi:MAG: hypothetical protein NDI90_08115 [Nitrospira sp. BO4]|jgi:hypothetical protein|nr:hypothetical protein [Nitrospira sp. BO4]